MRISKANMGHFVSEVTRKRISEAHKGMQGLKEEKSGSWKGDKVGYSGLHKWIRRQLGKVNTCEHCGKQGEYIFYWKQGKLEKRWDIQYANKSGEYKRDFNDWIYLCAKCHAKYDGWGFQKGYTPWNKKVKDLIYASKK